MAEPAKIDLNRIKRGDTYIVDFFFVDTDGTKDITAVNITAQARRELDGAVWFDLNPVKIDAANGHFRIHLTAFQTRAITQSPPGSFSGIYDIQFAWSGATEVYVSTIVSGSISITKDVTYHDVNVPVGGTSTAPAADQAIAVYFSLNPGTPNYSDVVTAEELTPAQYQIAASLGLANVNAITEAAESAKLAKGYRDEAATSAQSASQSANLAVSAKNTSFQNVVDAQNAVTQASGFATTAAEQVALAENEVVKAVTEVGKATTQAGVAKAEADRSESYAQAASGFADDSALSASQAAEFVNTYAEQQLQLATNLIHTQNMMAQFHPMA